MTTNLLPADVLCAPIDLYYFLWAPLSAACHNFKVAICENPTPTVQKTGKFVENNLKASKDSELSFAEMKIIHFFTHLGLGISLTLPVLNIFPFGCLVIKHKENWVPPIIEEPVKEKQKFQTSAVYENKKPVELGVISTPKTFDVKPEPKLNKTLPLISTPKTQETKLSEKTLLTKSRENFSNEQPITRRVSSPRIEKLKNMYETKQEATIQRSESSPLLHDRETAKKEIELEDEVVVNYFTLFPEGSSASLLRKAQDKAKPVNAEKGIVNELILNFPGHSKHPKFINAQANLKTLREFLVNKFGEKEGNLWIRETMSHDVQVQTKDNPCEIVRTQIFHCPAENYLNIIRRYEFVINRDCIEIR